MNVGRFNSMHSATTKAVCAASNKRPTSSHGAQGQALDLAHALGLALAAGPERWTAMEGGCPVIVEGECIGGVGVSGGDWATDERIARESLESIGATSKEMEPLRVACIGMGSWSDDLADALQRSDKLEIV